MTIQEKAIEQLERISSHLSAIGEKEDYTDIAIQALEQTRWIPVSERLPKYGKEVLTCSNDGFIAIQSIECKVWDEHNYWENQNGDMSDIDDVIAWMPLPETYKESEE